MKGKIVNGFELQKLLGKGGMAEVWYAENEIHMAAAVKILNKDLALNESIVERFRSEAEIMVKLRHPNIRQVYGYGSIDERPAIIMEYLEGNDLKARMKQGQRFTNEELKKWWNQLVDALQYTHKEGIVHRDIKPGNIFVDNLGNIKLLDYGIAKVRDSISSTQTGQKLGTLMYMSPEQVRDSKHIDYHTDYYSLSVTFVHLLTGKKPYNSDTSSDFDIQLNIVSKPLDLSEVPDEWKGFLSQYLNKDPEKRPELRYFEAVNYEPVMDKESKEQPNVEDESTVIDSNVTKQQPRHIKESKPKKEETPKKKSKTGLWIVLVLLVIAVGVVFFVMNPLGKSDNDAVIVSGEVVQIDKDTEAFNACTTISDYRSYIAYYGRNGKHYSEAKQKVDKHVADSTKTAKDKQKAEEARKEKERLEKEQADKQARAEEEKRAFNKCTTIDACNRYLNTYPNGSYVDRVREIKQELENKAAQEAQQAEYERQQKEELNAYYACTTIPACDAYLAKYPYGRFVADVRSIKNDLEEKAKAVKIFNIYGVSFEMVRVKGGTFTMGCTSEQSAYCYDSERPAHSVTLSEYYIGKFEVTQGLWKAVMGNNPSYFWGDNLPVDKVSWWDCQQFINKLNQITGQHFRLPTEAEWEFAARGGNNSKGYMYSGSNTLSSVAWYKNNSGNNPHAVGTKEPNELGIYDMTGNVWEWCSDVYGNYSSYSQTNPTGAYSGSERVYRGGAWSIDPIYCRVSNRRSNNPDRRSDNLGFRLVLVP